MITSLINVFSYGFFFIISILICQSISKIAWIRVHVFKEKIVEGKWFECIYHDKDMRKLYSYGIVDTFFDDNGEFVYKGIDYSTNGFKNIGEFRTTCSSLKYDKYDDKARLDYAYEFSRNNIIDHGYGNIDFAVSSYESKFHRGSFFNNDGKTYYFNAILITNKEILKDLKSGSMARLSSAMKKLIDIYNSDDISIREKITALYDLNPNIFDEFCRKEDFENNIGKELSKTDFKNKVVLDIGAGTGRLSERFIKDSAHLICTDSSEKMLNYLRDRSDFQNNSQKIEYVHCDHMAISVFLEEWKGKVDIITAGYTIGAYFNDDHITEEQVKNLMQSFNHIAESLLTEGGKLIIIESLGIEDESGNPELLTHDTGLATYYKILEDMNFSRVDIQTYFKFDDEEEAIEVISSFWGAEGISKITQEGNYWFLKEMSGVWTKEFKKTPIGEMHV